MVGVTWPPPQPTLTTVPTAVHFTAMEGVAVYGHCHTTRPHHRPHREDARDGILCPLMGVTAVSTIEELTPSRWFTLTPCWVFTKCRTLPPSSSAPIMPAPQKAGERHCVESTVRYDGTPAQPSASAWGWCVSKKDYNMKTPFFLFFLKQLWYPSLDLKRRGSGGCSVGVCSIHGSLGTITGPRVRVGEGWWVDWVSG